MGTRAVGLTRLSLGLLLTGAVATTGAGSAIYVQHRANVDHTASLHRAQSTLSKSFATRTGYLAGRARQYGEELSRLPITQPAAILAAAPRTDFTSVGLASAKLPLRATAGSALPVALRGAAASVQAAAVTSRDSASPVAVVTSAGSSSAVIVLWPLYRTAVPADTQARRNDAAGWVVGAVSVANLFAPVANAEHGLGVRTSVAVTAAGPASIVQTLQGGLAPRVTAVPEPSRVDLLMIGLLTLLACAALLGLTAVTRRQEREMDHRQRALDEQVRLVTDISMTIQESLDIGVVVPAVLTQISQPLDLTWVRVVVGATSEGVELLALGHRRRSLPTQRWSPDATTADAGQLVRLPLRRATRTLGHLELVPSRDLNAYQLTGLRQCADLLAGALHNAELYEREHDAVRRLRDLDALKDDFLGTVSHELRTPLSVLTGSVSLLSGSWDRLPEDARQMTVAKMQPHVASLANLVNDLLDFISDRRAVTAASPSLVDLAGEVRQLADQLRPLVHQQDLEVISLEPVTAWVDVRGLERIIGNFVGNAGKYSPAGTSIRIAVGKDSAGDAVVSVSDEGPGIRPEDRERIFERFYRGDSQAARSTRGSGIGLAVALTWIQAIGGRLEVHTAIGRGTTMSLHIASSQDAAVDDAGTVMWRTTEGAEEELVR